MITGTLQVTGVNNVLI